MTCAFNLSVKNFNKLMQITKCLFFKPIIFRNTSLININKKLTKYKNTISKIYTYTPL